jgi:ubiquinone/menaquinone biosynthesis C-methylase UbiE
MNIPGQQNGVSPPTDRSAELHRLNLQGGFFADLTELVFQRAGIGPDMHVLDVGCGLGDTSLLAATLVGPSGSVLGVDKSPEAIAIARQRSAVAGLKHLTFEVADLATFRPPWPVDALTGRQVLAYLANPAATLRHLLPAVRPGGVVVFQEMDMSAARSEPEVPLYTVLLAWIHATFWRAGLELDMGSKLHTTFRRAGLPAPEMLLSARVESGPNSYAYDYLAQTARSLLPLMKQFEIISTDIFEVDTFAARLREAVVDTGAVLVLPALVGAWARLPIV